MSFGPDYFWLRVEAATRMWSARQQALIDEARKIGEVIHNPPDPAESRRSVRSSAPRGSDDIK